MFPYSPIWFYISLPKLLNNNFSKGAWDSFLVVLPFGKNPRDSFPLTVKSNESSKITYKARDLMFDSCINLGTRTNHHIFIHLLYIN